MNTLIVKDAALIGSLASPNSFTPVLRYMVEGKLEGKTAHYPYQASGRLPERDRDDSGKEGNAYQDFVPAVTVNPAEFQLI